MCQRDTGPSHPRMLPLVILRTAGELLLVPMPALVIFANLPYRTTDLVVSFGLLLVGVLGLERVGPLSWSTGLRPRWPLLRVKQVARNRSECFDQCVDKDGTTGTTKARRIEPSVRFCANTRCCHGHAVQVRAYNPPAGEAGRGDQSHASPWVQDSLEPGDAQPLPVAVVVEYKMVVANAWQKTSKRRWPFSRIALSDACLTSSRKRSIMLAISTTMTGVSSLLSRRSRPKTTLRSWYGFPCR